MKTKLSQRGAIDIILILVVLVLAAGLGGYVYYQQRQANNTYNSAGSGATVTKHTATKSTTSTTTNPYNGWKTYTSAAEKVSFKYPQNWAFKEETNQMGLNGDDKKVTLTGPSGFAIGYYDSIGGLGGSCEGQPPVELTSVTKVTIPNAKADIYLIQSGAQLALDSAVLTGKAPAVGKTEGCIYAPMLPGIDGDHHPAFTTSALLPSGTPKALPANQTKDFATAKLILESFSY